MKPFLILQLRPETPVSDDEYQAFLRKGGLSADQTHRIRLDQQEIPADLDLSDYSGVIVGGGPGCVSDKISEKSPQEAQIEAACLGVMPQITEHDIPFLGCCYGIGILAHHLGAVVSKENYSEPVGAVLCRQETDDPLLADLPQQFYAFVGHKEAAQHLPEGCTHLVSSESCPMQMIRYKQNIYATQFHPEADGAGFELRIRYYKDKGYFAPQDAERLIDMCQAADVFAPELLLRNFVRRYAVLRALRLRDVSTLASITAPTSKQLFTVSGKLADTQPEPPTPKIKITLGIYAPIGTNTPRWARLSFLCGNSLPPAKRHACAGRR